MQVLIRWSLQEGFIPLPKSSNAGRQQSNLDVFSFELDDEDMAVSYLASPCFQDSLVPDHKGSAIHSILQANL